MHRTLNGVSSRGRCGGFVNENVRRNIHRRPRVEYRCGRPVNLRKRPCGETVVVSEHVAPEDLQFLAEQINEYNFATTGIRDARLLVTLLRDGCTKVVLSTHSFQAPDFYFKRGYVVTGEFSNYPQGHRSIFLEKYVCQESVAADRRASANRAIQSGKAKRPSGNSASVGPKRSGQARDLVKAHAASRGRRRIESGQLR